MTVTGGFKILIDVLQFLGIIRCGSTRLVLAGRTGGFEILIDVLQSLGIIRRGSTRITVVRWTVI